MSPNSATIIGSPVSPYVRKVLAVCEIKGIPYRLDPIVPFFGDEWFSELSPLRRIPVFVDDKVSLCDSTVICEYLEERYPTPRVLPSELVDRAQARWIEEFSDTEDAGQGEDRGRRRRANAECHGLSREDRARRRVCLR